MGSLNLFRIKEEKHEAERDDSLQGKGDKCGGKQAADHASGKMAAGYRISTGDRIAVTCVDGKLIVERTGRIWSDPKGAGMVAEGNAEYRMEAV